MRIDLQIGIYRKDGKPFSYEFNNGGIIKRVASVSKERDSAENKQTDQSTETDKNPSEDMG